MARGNWRAEKYAVGASPRKKQWVMCPKCGQQFATTSWTPKCRECKTKFKFWYVGPFRKEYQILEEGKR